MRVKSERLEQWCFKVFSWADPPFWVPLLGDQDIMSGTVLLFVLPGALRLQSLSSALLA